MNDDRSTQLRLLLAVVLSIGVMALWSFLYPPQKPKPAPPQTPPAQSEPAPTPAAPAPASSGPAAKTAPGKPRAAAPAATEAASPQVPAHAAAEEKTIVVENDLYRVEFSNRGGVVRSWLLKKYQDDHKPPETLDVVHPESSRQYSTWPLDLALQDAELEKAANNALYEVTPAATPLRAPAELTFSWSDGRLAVTKSLKFVSSYIVELHTEVTYDGKPLPHAIAWRGGFGDDTVYNAATRVQVIFRAGGKTQTLASNKLGNPDNATQRQLQEGTLDYAGIEDLYFAAAFLPPEAGAGAARPGVSLWHWRIDRDVVRDNKEVKEPVAEIAVSNATPGPVSLRLYVGPKSIEDLSEVNPPLTDLVQFGDWLGVIAKPLFYFLKWLDGYTHNFGWAIIILTIVINTALFPLKLKSWRSMQKMQKVQPEIKSIQDKYKKYSMRDPRKAEMNKEVMAVYSREGINPMGGCLPMLLQLPIWFALYRMLSVAIELRHAPWIFWIKDLSSHDPYYILPVLMALTGYWMQKMTPVTTTDPMQQKMMNLLPLMMGFFFFRISSGLLLYILSQYVIGITQQWYLNRTSPVTVKRKEK